MTRPTGRTVAVALAVGATALALVLTAYGGLTGAADAGPGTLALALGFGLVGAVLVTRVPTNPVGWILLVTGAGQVAEPALATVGVRGTGWVAEWAWAPGVYGVVAVLPHVFPSGPLPGRWWRAATMASVAAVGLATLGYALPRSAAVDAVVLAAEVGVVAAALLGLASLVVRWRRHHGEERQQLKWLLLASFVLLLAYVVADLLPTGVSGVVFVVVPLLLPVAIALAVLRHGLYEIDLILNRALVYGALSLLVLGTYAGGVALFGRVSGLDAGPALVTVVAVALLFDPLRRRLQRAVNRLTYGRRDEPLAVLREVGSRLEAAGPPEQVLPEVAAAIADSLRLPSVTFAVRLGGEDVEVATHGTPVDRPQELPLTWHEEVVGTLVVSPRRPGEPLTRADVRLLLDVAHQAGAVARSWQLAEELRRSHQRLAAIRDAERERLRGDLHDGLGPLLAGIGLGLGGVTRMIDPDDSVRPLVDRISGQVGSATAEVRRLIDELRPAALDELGLVAALRDHADLVASGSATRIDVVAGPGLGQLPPQVELAAYRIAMEALTNVVHHAEARTCTVSLAVDDDGLRLGVVDDGRGLDGSTWGVGLTSMSRRAQALCGTLELRDGRSRGAEVRAVLPLGTDGSVAG